MVVAATVVAVAAVMAAAAVVVTAVAAAAVVKAAVATVVVVVVAKVAAVATNIDLPTFNKKALRGLFSWRICGEDFDFHTTLQLQNLVDVVCVQTVCKKSILAARDADRQVADHGVGVSIEM